MAGHTGLVLVERIAAWGDATFAAAATPDELQRCDAALGSDLPEELRTLLSETNGVEGEYGLGLVWPVARIASDNLAFRTDSAFADLYIPFDAMVFFADAGNGDQFAIALRGNQEVFAWDHENDSRTWVAPSVMTYLEWWLSGRITL